MPTVTVTATGTGNFTIPAGVTSIEFEAWGGGGVGGSGANQQPGGGGGAYIKKTLTVSAGQIVYFRVSTGDQGSGAPVSFFNLGTNSDLAGDGAYIAGNGVPAGAGGTATSASGGGGNQGAADLAFSGGDGAAAQGGGGTRSGSGGGGGAGKDGAGVAGSVGNGATQGAGGAGDNGSGGAGGTTGAGTANVEGGGGGAGGVSAGDGFAGGAPGGGGGGKGRTGTSGGAGARGQIRYTYTVSGAGVTAVPGSYSITGVAATGSRTVPFTAGSYALTGAAATLSKGKTLTADPGSYSVGGIAAGSLHNYVLAIDDRGSEIVLNGTFGSDTSNWGAVSATLSVENQRLRVTATSSSAPNAIQTPTTLTVGHRYLFYGEQYLGNTADKCRFTFTGAAGEFNRDISTYGSPVEFAFTAVTTAIGIGCYVGSAVAFGGAGDYAEFDNISLRPLGNHYVATGASANLSKSVLLGVDPGSYSISGTATGTLWNRVLTAGSANYLVSGVDAELTDGGGDTTIVVDPGSYSITGMAASLLWGHAILANLGSYAISGQTAGLLHGYSVVAVAGGYTISGQAASLLWGRAIPIASGAYALTGTPANLIASVNYTLPVEPGSYALIGAAAAFVRGHSIATATGSYVITGADTGLEPGSIYDFGPEPRDLVIFRHQEAEIVRVPKLNQVARDLYNSSPAIDADDLATGGAGARYLFEPGREGPFIFISTDLSGYVAVDTEEGIFIAPAYDQTGASGAWVRVFNGPANVRWFGATGDGLTNDGTAFTCALAVLKMLAVNQVSGWYQASHELFVPAGHYYLGTTTLDITHTLTITGEGTGVSTGASKLRWAAGATGFRVQRYNTTGDTSTTSPGYNAGDGSVIRGLWLVGGYTSTEGEYHGIMLRAHASIEHCKITDFQGDGIYSNVVAGGSPEGAANLIRISHCRIWGCRRGLFLDGADTNACLVQALDVTANRTWGIEDSSFLGNTYIGCHAAANGWDGAAGSFPTACSYSGNRYYVQPGQAVGAKTNAPSGTTADNTWWGYIAAGGTYTGVPAWVTNTYDFREGGAYKTDNANAINLFLGCYTEGDQNPTQIVSPTVVFGGLQGAQVKGNGAYVIGADGASSLRALGFAAIGASGYGNILASDRLEFNTAADTLTLEWYNNDLIATVLRSQVSSNWPFRWTGEITSANVGKRKIDFPNGFGLADKKVLSGTAAPASGAYVQGDMMFNSAPTAGGPMGWMCVTGGTPGTWKAMANLAA